MRGSRPDRDLKSSESLLKPLHLEFHENFELHLFQHPTPPSIISEINSPLKEIFGVHHIKAFVFDDTVLLTGANMSEDYFTDRADRYWVIHNAPNFADWVDDLITAVSDVSLHVDWEGGKKYYRKVPDARKDKKGFKN